MSYSNYPGPPPGYDPNVHGGAPQQPPMPPTGAQQPPMPPGGPHQPGMAPGGPPYPAAGQPGMPPAGYPGYPGYPGGTAMPMGQSNGMGTAALVCGILGLVCGITYVLWLIAIVLGILAIIFGSIGTGKGRRGEASNGGSATAGIVCGIIGMVVPIIYIAAVGAALDSAF